MWKAISHSNTNQANIARRMFQNIGAEHIVVIDSVQTVIELAVPNKGLNSKKRKKRARDNDARFNHIMKENQPAQFYQGFSKFGIAMDLAVSFQLSV